MAGAAIARAVKSSSVRGAATPPARQTHGFALVLV